MDNDNNISQLTILTANVNGLGEPKKRSSFLNHINKSNPDIVCLIDTRFCKSTHDLIRNETGMLCFYNSFNSNSRGIAVLVNKKCPLTLELAYNDDRGNVLWLKCAYDDHTFMLGVIYLVQMRTACCFFRSSLTFISNLGWRNA